MKSLMDTSMLPVLIPKELKRAKLSPEINEVVEACLLAALNGVPVAGVLERRNLRWEMLAMVFHQHEDLYNLYCACSRAGEKKKLQILEAEAYRRAVEGVEKGVYHDGIRIDTERIYSDTLMVQALKAHDPDKYADRQKVEHRGVMLHLEVNGIKRDPVPVPPVQEIAVATAKDTGEPGQVAVAESKEKQIVVPEPEIREPGSVNR